jgi:hypothetical protein
MSSLTHFSIHFTPSSTSSQALKIASFEAAQDRELENQQLKETIRSLSAQTSAAQEQYGALEEHALALERRLAAPSSPIPFSATGETDHIL